MSRVGSRSFIVLTFREDGMGLFKKYEDEFVCVVVEKERIFELG